MQKIDFLFNVHFMSCVKISLIILTQKHVDECLIFKIVLKQLIILSINIFELITYLVNVVQINKVMIYL
jgi:hypothetical protein